MGDASKIIEALAAAAWPAMAFYVIWAYRAQVAAVIASAKDRGFTVEVGGQKLTMAEANQQQQKLIADLQAQLLDVRKRVEGFGVAPEASLAAAPAPPPASNAVLWVDDNPKNNSYFIELMQQHGYRVDLAVTTADGLDRAERTAYRLIISDMGRAEGGGFRQEAGIDLLRGLKERGVAAPVVLYCSTQGVARHRDQVQALGGRAITASPTELRAILDELAPGLVAA